MGFSNIWIKSYSVPIEMGGVTRITAMVDYQGPGEQKLFYAAIGNSGAFGFDEIIHGAQYWVFPNTPSMQSYEIWCDIPITSAIDPNQSPYDLYAKLDGLNTPTYTNLITIEGGTPPPPTEAFSDLIITGYTTPVAIGGVCHVTVSFQYKGPAQTRQLYAAIGNSGLAGFNEIVNGQANLSLPLTQNLTTRTASVDIPVTAAINPNESPYDLYAKISGKINSPTYNNIITVTGGTPNEKFQNLRITNYTTPVKQGQNCQVTVAFEYQGPAQSQALYAALGNSGSFGFNEIVAGQATLTVPLTSSLTTFTATVNVPVTTAISADDSPYDLYAKIPSKATSPTLLNVVYVQSVAPPAAAFRNFKIDSYTTPVGPGDSCVIKTSYEYQGPAQQKTLHAAIGNDGAFGFDEINNGEARVTVPESMIWTPYTAEVGITITADLSFDDSPYDLYAKLDGLFTAKLQNVLLIKGSAGTPDIKDFRITKYDSPVAVGDAASITVGFDYIGPYIEIPIYVAIGNNGLFGFDEILHKEVTFPIEAADVRSPRSCTMSIQITTALSVADSPYDMYAKIPGLLIGPKLNDVLGIEGGGPGAGDIVGSITSVSPLKFEEGKPVDVTVNYDAYTDNPQTQLAWQTQVTIEAGTLQGQATFDHFGPSITNSAKIELGTMPSTKQTGTVKLEGRKAEGEWITLTSQPVSFIPPGGEQPPSEGGGLGALGWVALAAVAAVAIGGGRKEPKPVSKPAKKPPKLSLKFRP